MSQEPTIRSRVLRAIGFRNASAIWVLVVIVVVFSITIPETFLAARTWTSLLDTQVVVAITALALVIPLAAGSFNLAVGAQVGVSSMMVGWMLVSIGLPVVPAIGLTLAASALIGLLMGLVIVRFHIDSFIASLGFSSLLAALVTFMSGGRQILGMPSELVDFGTARVVIFTYPFLILIALALVCWHVLERTPLGRRIYATGGNLEAARLAGIRTNRIIVGTLVACGLLSGVAGVLVTARLGNSDPTIGPAYLIPAFTAAFLGSTQFKGGRFNIWGTLLSVYVLAAGVKGLQLSGAPTWIPDAFNGIALLVAVGLASSARLGGRPSLFERLRHRRVTAQPLEPLQQKDA
ncbi:ABC transporter permease [Pseudolysinimonas yzui]|uniref:Sugar ABC transporter permease n=1 Tax=Pseudolysinimonas yzui TaxID=2708254 RepID=A0A8J3GSB4_9MICO|nr:ABC transporter permease [Pseudolysinimonas yzui]GHF22604.1 sugar ABC transporter permease [Pseudolysinimonas yzui]